MDVVELPLERLMVFTGNANPRLAQEVAKHLNLSLGRAIVGKFSDGEVMVELLENVQVHGYHMMRNRGRVVENAEIAANWYDAIYTPTLAAIERLNLTRVYRDAPPGDLFLVLHRHRRDAFPSTGCPHLAQTVVSVIGDGVRRRRLRLPCRGSRWPA